MIHIEWPWLGLIIIVPLLIWMLIPVSKPRTGSALRVPSLDRFDGLVGSEATYSRSSWCAVIGWHSLYGVV